MNDPSVPGVVIKRGQKNANLLYVLMAALMCCTTCHCENQSSSNSSSNSSTTNMTWLLGMESICPGIRHLQDPVFSDGTNFSVRESDCGKPTLDFPQHERVVYGICNDSRTFCLMHIQVPSGIEIIAWLRRFDIIPFMCDWKTDIYNSWPESKSPPFSVQRTVKCKDRFPYIRVLSNTSHMYLLHHNSPKLEILLQTYIKPYLSVTRTSAYTGNVTMLGHECNIPDDVDIWRALTAAPGHVIMIEVYKRTWGQSVVVVTLHFRELRSHTFMLNKRKAYTTPAHVYNANYTHIQVGMTTKNPFSGRLRLLTFSFHPKSQMPEKLSTGLFNCSVDYYSRFQHHLDCNLKQECEGGEDETEHCPFSSPECQGLVASNNKCFKRLELGILSTTYEISLGCEKLSGKLASIKTKSELRDFTQLFRYVDLSAVVGCFSGWVSTPFMYSQFLRWSDNTMIYGVNHIQLTFTPSRDHFYALLLSRNKMRFFKAGRGGILSRDGFSNELSQSFVCEFQTLSQALRVYPSPEVVLHDLIWESILSQTGLQLHVCRFNHVTHTFLSCDVKTHCGQTRNTPVCFFRNTRLTSTFNGTNSDIYTIAMFSCTKSIMTIPYSLVCDFRPDCLDNSDESFCRHPPCVGFQCDNAQCVPFEKRCDGQIDCLDDSDERQCPSGFKDPLLTTAEKQPFLVNFDGTGYFTKQFMAPNDSCPNTHYRCTTEWLYCLPVYTRCNGVYDCINQEDEQNCETVKCPGFYRCRGSSVCVHANHLCDGWPQCPQNDDERMCGMTCPYGCMCQGHSFLCPRPFSADLFPQIRYLDVTGSGMLTQELSNNTYIVHLILANCSLFSLSYFNFPNLQLVDLSNNKLKNITINIFFEAPNLQMLLLANNPLALLASEPSNRTHNNLGKIDLSRTNLGVFNSEDLKHFPQIRHLNLSFSALNAIGPGGFSTMPQLRELDLRGNAINKVSFDLFSGLNHLALIVSSNYRMCCRTLLSNFSNKARCFAPEPIISQCDYLLTESHRITFWSVGVIAILGNAVCLISKFVVNKVMFESHFIVLVAQLQFTNFLTGVYLTVIVIVDQVFHGEYLYHEDAWKNGIICKMAGVLSLLSSELSVLIIFVMTLHHVMILSFSGKTLRLNKRTTAAVSALTWLLSGMLALIPLLPGISYWEAYNHSGLCSSGLSDSTNSQNKFILFKSISVFNGVLHVLVLTGQAVVYRAVPDYRVLIDPSKSSTYLSVHMLKEIAVTDAMCWFSASIINVMALAGIVVSHRTNTVIAVFVLPFNSALNPLLYIWNRISIGRQQKQEQRLLTLLKTQLLVSQKTVT